MIVVFIILKYNIALLGKTMNMNKVHIVRKKWRGGITN